MEKIKTGIELIAQKRKEQIEKHGRTIEHDIKHNHNFQLSEAASFISNLDVDPEDYDLTEYVPQDWDMNIFDNICRKPYQERLIIAGALIAAELDRINNMKGHE